MGPHRTQSLFRTVPHHRTPDPPDIESISLGRTGQPNATGYRTVWQRSVRRVANHNRFRPRSALEGTPRLLEFRWGDHQQGTYALGPPAGWNVGGGSGVAGDYGGREPHRRIAPWTVDALWRDGDHPRPHLPVCADRDLGGGLSSAHVGEGGHRSRRVGEDRSSRNRSLRSSAMLWPTCTTKASISIRFFGSRRDQRTIEALARATHGVFYIESPAMRQLQKKPQRRLRQSSSIARSSATANKTFAEYVRRLKVAMERAPPASGVYSGRTYASCAIKKMSPRPRWRCRLQRSDADKLRK